MRKNRNPPFKNKIKYAIEVDGECEFWYVQMLKRNEPAINFDLSPKIPQKKKLEDQHKRVIELADIYDKVFWIIDCDVIASETHAAKKGSETPQQQLEKYSKEDYQGRIVIIRNNPCLEYWLLLHFEETVAQFNNCDDAGKRLKKHLAGYEKTQTFYTRQNKDIYLQLKPHLAKAIINADKINKQAANNQDVSISQMYLLFQALGLSGK